MKKLLKKLTELKANDLLYLTTFAVINLEESIKNASERKSDEDFLKKQEKKYDNIPIKYKELIQISFDNKDMNVSIPIIKFIDDLMFDNYKNYDYLNKNTSELAVIRDTYKGILDVNQYLITYEKIMLGTKFDNPAIRTVQKMFLENQIEKEIRNENYEQCTVLQKIIKEV